VQSRDEDIEMIKYNIYIHKRKQELIQSNSGSPQSNKGKSPDSHKGILPINLKRVEKPIYGHYRQVGGKDFVRENKLRFMKNSVI